MWAFFEKFFRDHDFLLTPSMAVSPFPVEQNFPESVGGMAMKTYVDWIAPTFTLSLSGLPVAYRLIQEAYPIQGPDLEALETAAAFEPGQAE